MNNATHTSKTPCEAMDEERKFLEGLLKDRFNFFIVSAPVYLFGVQAANISHAERIWALAVGLIIFVLFTLALRRTNKLVNETLDILRCKHPQHPYSIISNSAGPFPRANNILLGVCYLVVVLAFILLITTCTSPTPAGLDKHIHTQAVDK